VGEKPIEETAGEVGEEREGTFNGLPLYCIPLTVYHYM